MFFLLFGSSGAGKTAALEVVRRRRVDFAVHDFDELGVPADLDPAEFRRWRHRSNEVWVVRALEYEKRGLDLLLAGQTPLGELLATPSAPRLEAISACLLDCDDATRLTRLGGRPRRWWARSTANVADYLRWAEWLRRHAEFPWYLQHVIRDGGLPEMRWEHWVDWSHSDPRWRVHVIDSSESSVDEVADELQRWIEDERELFRSGHHPLAGWTPVDGA